MAVATAAPQYAAPAPAYGPVIAEPLYPDTVPAYNYNYGVADSLSGANFGASEARDGYNTNGEYHVALPDGRLQTVTYTADANGYIADVKYAGEPVYAPAPAYGPAPVRAVAVAPAPVPIAVAAPAPILAPFAPRAILPAAPIFRPALAPRPVLLG